MGEFLSTPNKDKISEDNENIFVRISLISVTLWGLWHAGMEKEDGGFPHF